jgi:hypothetical protein
MALKPNTLPLPQVVAPSLLVQSYPEKLPNGQIAYCNSVFLQLPDGDAGQSAPSVQELAPWIDGVGKLATQLLLAGQWPLTSPPPAGGTPATAGTEPALAKPLPQPWQRQA